MGFIIKSIRIEEIVWQRLLLRARRENCSVVDLIERILKNTVKDEMAVEP